MIVALAFLLFAVGNLVAVHILTIVDESPPSRRDPAHVSQRGHGRGNQ